MKIPNSNVEISGVNEIVINKKVFVKSNDMWIRDNKPFVVIKHDDMIHRVKGLMQTKNAHIWLSGYTINVSVGDGKIN